MIEKDFTILVGDANGADKAVQRYLAEKGYRNVIVHCMANNCRNNVADWPTREILPPKGARGFTYYAAKGQHPRMRPPHGEIRARFIDEHQAARVDALHPAEERLPLRRDIGPIHFTWSRPFFLHTKPKRRRARPMARADPAVVLCAQLGGRRIGDLADERRQQESVDRRFPAAAAGGRFDRPARAMSGEPALHRSVPKVESLLGRGESAEGFLSRPAVDVAAHLFPGADRKLIGRRLGAYRIDSRLGAGGMGEVYRARDMKLGRDVAIKVLPPIFTSDLQRLKRFEREARMLAALNHPHIGAIYGLEDVDGLPALVLELVEGPTLAERLSHGALPVSEALSIARQTAEALEAAHDRGIVHRDIKPANIKVTPDATVKVLDFGLAQAGGTELNLSQASKTVNVTMEGAILGTVAYMSPEQARGQAVDRRTDIWAFGCVLFEMLTGQPAFGGPTMTDVLAAILERDPDWSALPSATPLIIRRLLERCLEKDVKKRLRDIGDARIEFEEVLAGKHTRAAAVRQIRTSLSVRWLLETAILGVALTTSAYVLISRTSERGSTGPPLRMNFSQLTSAPGVETFPSLSPDGKWVVYAGEGSGNRDIYLQSATGQMPINLTSDSPADDDQPVFSPDGERIAFRSSREGGGIFVMGRTGESVRRVTREGFKPTWSPDGTQLAYMTENVELTPQNQASLSQLWVVNVSSGESKKLDVQDAILASWSPRGHRIAYAARVRALWRQEVPEPWIFGLCRPPEVSRLRLQMIQPSTGTRYGLRTGSTCTLQATAGAP